MKTISYGLKILMVVINVFSMRPFEMLEPANEAIDEFYICNKQLPLFFIMR